jgi:nucleoside-diphosphate-sugar epimerase
MTISIIGTNGLLATELGLFCNQNQILIKAYGRKEPIGYSFDEFNAIDLMFDDLDVNELLDSDVIFYSTGSGIQSNLKDSSKSIYKLNTFVPISLCQELSEMGFKGTIVTFGSCFEIGNNNESFLFSEKDVVSSVLDVPNDYCVSKRLLTKFVVSKNQTLKHLHLILPTIYGEREAEHRLVPYTVSSIKQNLSMQFTSGKQIRQYLYAGDVPKIIFELISLRKVGIFNVSGIETFSVRTIVEEIYKFYGITTNEELFGKAERADVGMQNLQLDGTLIKTILPDFKYSRFNKILKLYNECY